MTKFLVWVLYLVEQPPHYSPSRLLAFSLPACNLFTLDGHFAWSQTRLTNMRNLQTGWYCGLIIFFIYCLVIEQDHQIEWSTKYDFSSSRNYTRTNLMHMKTNETTIVYKFLHHLKLLSNKAHLKPHIYRNSPLN